MNPYRELGVHPTSSIDEIEARYRLLMREHHPDFHQGEGAEAIAEAERRTRNLNFAMDRIRQDRETEGDTPAWTWDDPFAPDDPAGDADDGTGDRKGPWAGDNPFWRPPGDDRSTRVNNDTRARDWYGNAIPTDQPVPCPFCRRPFDRLAEYELHLREVHRFRTATPDDAMPSRVSGLIRTIGVLRFIPAWLVLLIAIALWMTFGFFWFVGALVFLLLVVWTQTSKTFRGR